MRVVRNRIRCDVLPVPLQEYSDFRLQVPVVKPRAQRVEGESFIDQDLAALEGRMSRLEVHPERHLFGDREVVALSTCSRSERAGHWEVDDE